MSQSTSSPAPTSNERLKESSPTLAGTIAQTLADPQADRFSDDDNQFLKFHGIYQEDDRDLRKTGKKYIMMIRVRVPGGILTPAQYLELDRLSDLHANGTLRITSRQTLQFHGVLKSNLAATIKGINDSLLTTLATCGDVVRNITAPPSPDAGSIGAQLLAETHQLSEFFSPVTPSYHSIWLDGQQLELAEPFSDPIYQQTYLPRKFKIGFAIPPVNDTDVYTNDVGVIAIVENGKLVGYNFAVGGGMGRSHNNPETFPRLADVVGFIKPEHLEQALLATVTIHRDFGDRTNRKHARLKYVLADRGVEWFRGELERRAGIKLELARNVEFTGQADAFGWNTSSDGTRFLGLWVETGRIKDVDGRRTKAAFREIVAKFNPEVRLTPNNNIIFSNLRAEDQEAVNAILAAHNVPLPGQVSAVRRASTACVSLPTCALALAESERYFPGLLTRIEGLLAQQGLGNEEITVRIAGCPNGCSRPYMAEIGLVGKAPGKYQLYLGGNASGTRLNRLWKDVVKDDEIDAELGGLFARFAGERQPAERFGDWAVRTLWSEPQPA